MRRYDTIVRVWRLQQSICSPSCQPSSSFRHKRRFELPLISCGLCLILCFPICGSFCFHLPFGLMNVSCLPRRQPRGSLGFHWMSATLVFPFIYHDGRLSSRWLAVDRSYDACNMAFDLGLNGGTGNGARCWGTGDWVLRFGVHIEQQEASGHFLLL